MLRVHVARIALTLLLFVALAAQPVWGVQPQARNGARPGLAALASNAVTSLWRLLTGSRQKEGCWIDPHGGCATGQSSPETETGCWLDPHGGCATPPSTIQTDEGCWLDPNGGCTAGK